MAVRRAFLCPPLTRLLSGFRNCHGQLNRGNCHLLYNLSQKNRFGVRDVSRVFGTVAQQNSCCTSARSHNNVTKERLDGQDDSTSSRTSTSSELETDPSMEKRISFRGDDANKNSVTNPASMSLAVESTFKSSSRHDLAMLFTCTVCNLRSAKTMSRATYDTGVVIVRCPGCQNLHLIADRYGWFGEPGSVEDFLAEKGVDVRKGSDSSYEFSMEDMAGWTPKGKPKS